MKTFVQQNLNCDNEEEDHFDTWERQFRSFSRSSGLDGMRQWTDYEAALEACNTFKKAMSVRKQMPAMVKEDQQGPKWLVLCAKEPVTFGFNGKSMKSANRSVDSNSDSSMQK